MIALLYALQRRLTTPPRPRSKPSPLVLLNREQWAWYYHFFCIWVGVVFTGIGLGVLVGPERWHTAPSLLVLHHYLLPFWHIPWDVWGGLFLLVALMLTTRWTRLAAFTAGAVVASLFIVFSVLFSLLLPAAAPAPPAHHLSTSSGAYAGTTNVIAIGLSALAPLALLAGIRYSVILATGRRRRP